MTKNGVYAIAIVVVICLSLVFAITVLNGLSNDDFSDTNFSEADFPLEIDLDSTVFNVGDKIPFTTTITNRSGKAVKIVSNGYMPCTYLRNINDDTIGHAEFTGRAEQILKAGDIAT
jgi:hypothetical protein